MTRAVDLMSRGPTEEAAWVQKYQMNNRQALVSRRHCLSSDIDFNMLDSSIHHHDLVGKEDTQIVTATPITCEPFAHIHCSPKSSLDR